MSESFDSARPDADGPDSDSAAPTQAAAPAVPTVPTVPTVIETTRLALPLVSAGEAADIVDGCRAAHWHPDFPRPDDRDAASMVAAASHGWGPRHLVRRGDGVIFGGIGFFGPPSAHDSDGVLETEVGFGMVEEARGRGLASEALAALLAETDRVGVRIRAAARPDNAASLRVLAKAGFTGLRGSDEDGHLVMVRPLRG